MPQKHTFRASKGNGGFTHAQRPGHKGDSGFSLATHCTKKASNAASEVWTRHLCGDDGSRPGSKTTRQSATRPHWCGGRRRDRRVRAGFETRRRAKRSRLVSRAAGPSGARNTRGATSNTRRKNDAPSEARSADGQRAAAAHRHTQRPGPPAPGTPAGPQATPEIWRAGHAAAGDLAGPQAPPNGEASELLVVLRVLVGLAAVGAAKRTDRRHLLG